MPDQGYEVMDGKFVRRELDYEDLRRNLSQ
jgi:hypothetical protein